MKKYVVPVLLAVSILAGPFQCSGADDTTRELIAACLSGDFTRVKQLLGPGIDVNSQNEEGLSPLMAASYAGKPEIVVFLLDAGTNVNGANLKGHTALIVAATQGQAEVAKLLVDRGADPSLMDSRGLTALDMAKEQGNRDVVALLEAIEPAEKPIPNYAEVVSVDDRKNCLPIMNMPAPSAKQVGCARIGEKLKLRQIWTNTNWVWVTEPTNGWVPTSQVKPLKE